MVTGDTNVVNGSQYVQIRVSASWYGMSKTGMAKELFLMGLAHKAQEGVNQNSKKDTV